MKDFNFSQYNFKPTEYSQKAVGTFYRQQFARALALHRRNGITEAQYRALIKDGTIPEAHLNSLKVKNKTKTVRPHNKLHKRHTPKIVTNTIKFNIGKNLVAPLAKHDINLNPYYRELRIRKKMRLNVRDEAEEMANALFPVLIKHCEFSIHSEFLFEVRASLPQIAYEIGLLEQTNRYDRLHRAIETMQEAGLIVVINQFNADLYQQRAMRIFLLPDFFYSIGHTPEGLRKLVAGLERHYIKKGKKDSVIARNLAHETRIKQANVADIQSNDKTRAYYRLLKDTKKDFLADAVFRKADNFGQKCKAKAERNAVDVPFLVDVAPLPLSQEENAKRWTAILAEFRKIRQNE